MFFVGADEGGVVLKAALGCRFEDGDALGDQGARQEEALAQDVIVDGVSGFRLEFPHQVVFAEKKMSREGVHGQVAAQVPVDVAEKLLHLGIGGIGATVGEVVLLEKHTVHIDHELGKEGVL